MSSFHNHKTKLLGGFWWSPFLIIMATSASELILFKYRFLGVTKCKQNDTTCGFKLYRNTSITSSLHSAQKSFKWDDRLLLFQIMEIHQITWNQWHIVFLAWHVWNPHFWKTKTRQANDLVITGWIATDEKVMLLKSEDNFHCFPQLRGTQTWLIMVNDG